MENVTESFTVVMHQISCMLSYLFCVFRFVVTVSIEK